MLERTLGMCPQKKNHCEASGILNEEHSPFRVTLLRCSSYCIAETLWTPNTRLRHILILNYLWDTDVEMPTIYRFWTQEGSHRGRNLCKAISVDKIMQEGMG